MNEKITTANAISLESTKVIAPTGKLTLNPMLVYLSQLSPSSRRTMRGALETIAKIVSAGELDAIGFPWAELRYQHTQAIYTQLSEKYAALLNEQMNS